MGGSIVHDQRIAYAGGHVFGRAAASFTSVDGAHIGFAVTAEIAVFIWRRGELELDRLAVALTTKR